MSEPSKEEVMMADGEVLSRLLKEAVMEYLKERNYETSDREQVARAYSRTLVESILILSSLGAPSEVLKNVCAHAIAQGSELVKTLNLSNSRGGDA